MSCNWIKTHASTVGVINVVEHTEVGGRMIFKDVEEIQSLLDKTTSTKDRLHTSLMLLSEKKEELRQLIAPLESILELVRQRHEDTNR